MQLEQFNLRNKLAQTALSPTKCLMPLFEAIANSFNAIQEAKEEKGKITVTIVREKKQKALPQGKGEKDKIILNEPVTGFIVVDNGAGFNEVNLASFKEAYSALKQAVGGKGIGRILWLKAFKSAGIDSVFVEGKKKKKRRTFTFEIGNDDEPVTKDTTDERHTIVRLNDYLPEYKEECPVGFDTIARRIIAHFIEAFILESCPDIVLKDGNNEVSLTRYFKNDLRLEAQTKHFTIDGHKFKIEHLSLVVLPETTHAVHYCAGSPARSVEASEMKELIPTLRSNLVHTNGKPFVYTAYVSGNYLENNLDELRSRFDIPDEGSLFQGEGGITRQAIMRKVAEKANEYLQEYLSPIREKNTERIKQYIYQHEPKYRPLAKHRSHWFERIPPNLEGDDLSVELYRLSREYDAQLLKERPKITATQLATATSIKAKKEKFNAFLTEWNDQGMSKLADYIIHRKATLQFLKESLELLATDEYAAESQIHRIICPMRTTSDDVPAEQMNLWVIDERLSYHDYMASDKEMKSLAAVHSGSAQRADLILFNCAVAFADKEFSSVVIVEFKRPMRDDYDDKENPIQQIIEYVDTLRAGSSTDKKGRPLQKLDDVPFYAFIVCDITPKLKKFMKPLEFVGSANEETYYKYMGGDYKTYIEVISFNRLLRDAERRNQAFFDKLNLHLTPPMAHTPAAEVGTGSEAKA